jgi:hypothetical protein
VHDQIEVTLSVSDFDIGQASIGSLGQHVKTGREEDDLGRRDGQFTLLGSRRGSGNTDNVSSTEEGVDFIEVLFVFGVSVIAGPVRPVERQSRSSQTY